MLVSKVDTNIEEAKKKKKGAPKVMLPFLIF